MAKECRKCKSWKDCEGHVYIVKTDVGKQYVSWYHYGEIRWCPLQVKWIIENAEKLRAGKWPTNPEGSSYIDPGIKTGYASEGYYVKPVGILAEVNARLAQAGIYGKLLRAEVLADLELSQESKLALLYCKGWRRKHSSFSLWLKQRKYRSGNLTFQP